MIVIHEGTQKLSKMHFSITTKAVKQTKDKAQRREAKWMRETTMLEFRSSLDQFEFFIILLNSPISDWAPFHQSLT